MAEETDPNLTFYPGHFCRESNPIATAEMVAFPFLVGIRVVEMQNANARNVSKPTTISCTYFTIFRSRVDLSYSALLARFRDWLPQETKDMTMVLHLDRMTDRSSSWDDIGQQILHLITLDNCYYSLDLLRTSSARILHGVTLGSAEAVAGLGKGWRTHISLARGMELPAKVSSGTAPSNQDQVSQVALLGRFELAKAKFYIRIIRQTTQIAVRVEAMRDRHRDRSPQSRHMLISLGPRQQTGRQGTAPTSSNTAVENQRLNVALQVTNQDRDGWLSWICGQAASSTKRRRSSSSSEDVQSVAKRWKSIARNGVFLWLSSISMGGRCRLEVSWWRCLVTRSSRSCGWDEVRKFSERAALCNLAMEVMLHHVEYL